jgi:hypothetical protein
MPSPFPEPPSHAQLIHAMQQQQQHMNHPGIRPMMQPGRNPMFSAPPPIYMRFQGPPPGMMPGRGRGMLNTGPVPGQVRFCDSKIRRISSCYHLPIPLFNGRDHNVWYFMDFRASLPPHLPVNLLTWERENETISSDLWRDLVSKNRSLA